ncbi:MAG TPA: Rad52/Rad22 family DNA repair protein [Chitinophagaceae bacterium]|nr:Rad52/Rad22 family DNA repair protein [Chitinophagaceae bacterium]
MNLQLLKKELPYSWRVQSIIDFNAVCVAYIDSRDVQDLLDEAVGQENWQSDYKEVKGNVYAGVSILINGQWVWKWDCGVESKTEAEKGEASDSFKRAAVKWGIGRFLYSLEIKKLKSIEYKGRKYPQTEEGKILFSGDELTDYLNGNTPLTDMPTKSEKDILRKLAYNAKFDSEETKQNAFNKIEACDNYTDYQKIQHRLEELQPSFDEIPNPSQKDITQKIRMLS